MECDYGNGAPLAGSTELRIPRHYTWSQGMSGDCAVYGSSIGSPFSTSGDSILAPGALEEVQRKSISFRLGKFKDALGALSASRDLSLKEGSLSENVYDAISAVWNLLTAHGMMVDLHDHELKVVSWKDIRTMIEKGREFSVALPVNEFGGGYRQLSTRSLANASQNLHMVRILGRNADGSLQVHG